MRVIYGVGKNVTSNVFSADTRNDLIGNLSILSLHNNITNSKIKNSNRKPTSKPSCVTEDIIEKTHSATT